MKSERKIRVLLVDDQKDFLESISFWMKSQGYEVTTLSDGERGVDFVKSKKADLVFVDYKMNGMHGFEMIKSIRKFNKKIPIVAITAYPEEARQFITKDLNVSGFFYKMAKFDELQAIMEVVLRGVARSMQ